MNAALRQGCATPPGDMATSNADLVALDGPLHLAFDRGSKLRYDNSTIHPPDPNLWGGSG